MNTNRLSLKDYIIIYFIVFIIVAFLGGFFLGAKVMKSQIKNTTVAEKNNKQSFNMEEIISFYEKIYNPTREWNQDVYNIFYRDGTIDDVKISSLTDNGKLLISNNKADTYDSLYLKEAIKVMKKNVELTNNSLEQRNTESYTAAIEQYLLLQSYFYQNIWIWEQTLYDDYIITRTDNTWNEWNKANLHQKNYIIALILNEEKIQTFRRPEDITVHVDAYYKANNKNTSLNLNEVVSLLIDSDAISEKAFIKYKENYNDVVLPEIPNFF